MTPTSEHHNNWTARPWWLKGIIEIGITGSLVVYLVWMGSQELPATRRTADQALAVSLQNQELIRQVLAQTGDQYRMLQRICSNTAKNDEERNRCFDK